MIRRTLILLTSGILLANTAVAPAFADERNAKISRVRNKVEARFQGMNRWLPVRPRLNLSSGDQVKTGQDSRVELVYDDGTVARLGSQTSMTIRSSEGRVRSIRLLLGRIFVKTPKNHGGVRIYTPSAVAAIAGSFGSVTVGENGTTEIQNADGTWTGYTLNPDGTPNFDNPINLDPGDQLNVDPNGNTTTTNFNTNEFNDQENVADTELTDTTNIDNTNNPDNTDTTNTDNTDNTNSTDNTNNTNSTNSTDSTTSNTNTTNDPANRPDIQKLGPDSLTPGAGNDEDPVQEVEELNPSPTGELEIIIQ